MHPDRSNAPGVLLVEDNPVNQKVASRFLERMGCNVMIASNGAEAVAACRDRRFALVLMDLQMPVMDGWQATRAIRSADGNARHTPIVALSANAMPDQVAQCLNAGMDDFLSKPIDISRLREVVALHGAANERLAATQTQPAIRLPTTAPIELHQLRQLSDGDAGFMSELIAMFLDSSTSILSEIRLAHASSDRAAIARAAHKLKGACANVFANSFRELASRLETDSASLSSSQLEASIIGLSLEMLRLRDFLRSTQMLAA
ncbi:MAG: response regulator [Steroidobacteraceae bacterium]